MITAYAEKQLLCGFFQAIEIRIFLPEAINTTSGVNKTLLAGVKGMAVGTNFGFDLFALGSQQHSLVTAMATNFGLKCLGMNIFFHDDLLSFFSCGTWSYTRRAVAWQAKNHGFPRHFSS
jgi:hypothetical protein